VARHTQPSGPAHEIHLHLNVTPDQLAAILRITPRRNDHPHNQAARRLPRRAARPFVYLAARRTTGKLLLLP